MNIYTEGILGNNYLIVVDTQNDFVTGSLGSEDAQRAMEHAVNKAKAHRGPIIFTLDTHGDDYLDTQEGKMLPVAHCIKGSDGWNLIPEMADIQQRSHAAVFEKTTFASVELGAYLAAQHAENPITGIELIGLCTDICVASNALAIKGFLPEVPISVDSACCAGTSSDAHNAALTTMQSCQINII